MVIPLVAALGMSVYLVREWTETRFREDILSLKASAEQTLAVGKLLDAYYLYSDLVAKSQGSSDEQVIEILARAEAERDKLFPKVKVQLEQKDQEAAAVRSRAEAERRWQAEQARLVGVTADLRGGAWVTKTDGQSDILRGLSVSVVRTRIPRRELDKVLEVIKGDKDLADETSLLGLFRQPADAMMDLEKVHQALNLAYWEHGDTAIKAIRLSHDKVWPLIVKQALVVETVASIDGKYEIKSLKGGHYLLHARHVANYGVLEWLIRLDIEQSGEIKQDLFNKTATEIVNKG
jgi:hypothetical protein